MREHGLVTVNEDNHIFLTEEGLAIASHMYERHELLTNMLMALGVSRETAMRDACKIEHDLSEETFAAIKRHMEAYAPDKGC
jgi:Mn-dependent DtxR family transcriptional regulator